MHRAASMHDEIRASHYRMDETYILRALKRSERLPSEGFRRIRPGPRHSIRGRRQVVFQSGGQQVMLEDYVKKLQRTGSEDSYDLLTPRERRFCS